MREAPRYTTIRDLAAHIESLMGSEGDEDTARRMAEQFWPDGDPDDLTTDEFYALWDEAHAAEKD